MRVATKLDIMAVGKGWARKVLRVVRKDGFGGTEGGRDIFGVGFRRRGEWVGESARKGLRLCFSLQGIGIDGEVASFLDVAR